VRLAPPEFEFAANRSLPFDFVKELTGALREYSGRHWQLRQHDQGGTPTLRETLEAAQSAEREAVLKSPVVAAAMEAFPDAELIGWSKIRSN
jgi:DNA polymerase-3 subunit gamma/tau